MTAPSSSPIEASRRLVTVPATGGVPVEDVFRGIERLSARGEWYQNHPVIGIESGSTS